ncbi:MAG: FecR domain-containing protein [Terriglobia bacterium]
MMETRRRISQAALMVLVTAVVAVADTSSTTNNMPPPGTLNYVEGQVSVQGQKQSPKSVGATYLEPNQVLDTGNGNAEMLLTPGIFMRIGHNSEVKMISPGLADTQVELTHGSAMVEVDELFKENDVSVKVSGATTRIEKQGLYDFTANPASVKVLEGKAIASEGNQQLKLTKGREVLAAEAQPLVRQKFNTDQAEEDPLYRWSKLRSDYATESNIDAGNELMTDGGWWGPGWYWDPFYMDFAFMPGFGMGWGAFGYPFFSPWMVGYAPYYGFGYRGGYGAYGGYRGYSRANLPPLAHRATLGSAGFRALPRAMAGGRMGMGGGFRGRSMGGFHGGGMVGGFHGGGMGGGFHGGGFGGGRR